MSGFVPQAWNSLLAAHRTAQVARDRMLDRTQPQTEIDRATIDFGQALDRMFAAMNQLSEAQDTGRITLLLARKDRR